MTSSQSHARPCVAFQNTWTPSSCQLSKHLLGQLSSAYLSHAHLPVFTVYEVKSKIYSAGGELWPVAPYSQVYGYLNSQYKKKSPASSPVHALQYQAPEWVLSNENEGKNKEQLKKKFEENTDYFNASLIWAVPNKEVWFALKSVIGTQIFLDSTACW